MVLTRVFSLYRQGKMPESVVDTCITLFIGMKFCVFVKMVTSMFCELTLFSH